MLNLFTKKKKDSRSRYIELKVRDVVRETPDAVTLLFDCESDIPYRAGQYLTLILSVNGKEERRSYSLCSAPKVDGHLAITAKRIAGGVVSNYLNDRIQVGDTLKAMEPGGNFTFEQGGDVRHYVLVAAGSGITPLLSILKSILYHDQAQVSLIYGNRDEHSIIFKAQLDQLERTFADRFGVRHTLSQPSATWAGSKGRISADMVRELLGSLPKISKEKTHFYLCGPEGLMQMVQSVLREAGYPEANVRQERFVASSSDKGTTTPASEKVRTVTIVLNGEEHEIQVGPGESILEAGLDNDLDMPFSCQSGICTACMGKLLSGEVEMEEDEGLSEEDKAEGYVLNCVGHPKTDDVRIEIE